MPSIVVIFLLGYDIVFFIAVPILFIIFRNYSFMSWLGLNSNTYSGRTREPSYTVYYPESAPQPYVPPVTSLPPMREEDQWAYQGTPSISGMASAVSISEASPPESPGEVQSSPPEPIDLERTARSAGLRVEVLEEWFKEKKAGIETTATPAGSSVGQSETDGMWE